MAEIIKGKTLVAWMGVKYWCRKNPGKRAVIGTVDGVFELRFFPNDPKLPGVDPEQAFKEAPCQAQE